MLFDSDALLRMQIERCLGFGIQYSARRGAVRSEKHDKYSEARYDKFDQIIP